MVDAFSTALGTALTGFVSDLTDGIGSNLALVLPVTLGIMAVFIIWRVVAKMVSAR